MNPNELTQEQRQLIVDRGNRSEKLLRDVDFAKTVGDVENDLVRGWMGSEVPHTKERESYYHQFTALKLVVSKLQEWVSVRDQLIQRESSVAETEAY